MRQSLSKHGKPFVIFVAMVVFCASFFDSYFVLRQIKNKDETIKTDSFKVLGESTEMPAGAIPGKLLVQFKKDPKIKYQSAIRFTVPLLNITLSLRREGFVSTAFGTQLDNILISQPIKEAGESFRFSDNKSLQTIVYENSESLGALKAELETNPEVESVGYDYFVKLNTAPNDPYYPLQWNLDQINIESAWNILSDYPNNNPILVAVLDTGMAYENYQDPYPSYCYDECGPNYACINANAQYAKHPDINSGSVVPGKDIFDASAHTAAKDPHPDDDHFHGTYVSSVILQSINNGQILAGMNNHQNKIRAKVMPIKMIDRFGNGTVEGLLSGLNYILEYNQEHIEKVRIANLSLGMYNYEYVDPGTRSIVESAVNDLKNNEVLLIAASGNDGSSPVSFPASIDSIVSVGAVRFDKQRATYSNFGTGLDLVAPGGEMVLNSQLNDQNGDGYIDGIFWTTLIPSSDPYEPAENDFTNFTSIASTSICNSSAYGSCGLYQGTSGAAPHVSALAAMILFINPNLSIQQVENILKTNTYNPYNDTLHYGSGLINAQTALQAAVDSLPTATPTPTNTPVPTATSTPIPTNTPRPTSTPNPSPSPSPTPTTDPNITPSPTPTTDPNASPTPTTTTTPTPTASATPTPAEWCGDNICQAKENIGSCYQDCCLYISDQGDINKDCRINSADWGIMWSNWTRAADK